MCTMSLGDTRRERIEYRPQAMTKGSAHTWDGVVWYIDLSLIEACRLANWSAWLNLIPGILIYGPN